MVDFGPKSTGPQNQNLIEVTLKSRTLSFYILLVEFFSFMCLVRWLVIIMIVFVPPQSSTLKHHTSFFINQANFKILNLVKRRYKYSDQTLNHHNFSFTLLFLQTNDRILIYFSRRTRNCLVRDFRMPIWKSWFWPQYSQRPFSHERSLKIDLYKILNVKLISSIKL